MTWSTWWKGLGRIAARLTGRWPYRALGEGVIFCVLWAWSANRADVALKAHRWADVVAWGGLFIMSILWRRAADQRQRLEFLLAEHENASRPHQVVVKPTQEECDTMRAMVMDPELDDGMRQLLQPLARWLERVESERTGA
jgi:uncharacterized protein YndB with AHSA1/START domain